MRNIVALLGLTLCLSAGCGKVSREVEAEELPLGLEEGPVAAASVRLIFAGDLMGHDTQIHAARREGGGTGYDYRPVYQHLKSYFSSADLAIINLEHTLGGEPYAGYPLFSSPDESVIAVQDAGFNIIATANNHSVDRGRKGLERTVSILDSLGLKHFGIYRNAEEREKNYPLIVEKNGIKMAFLNYTYGTNEIRVTPPNIVNPIDTVLIAADIKKAKEAEPDFIIAFMHWGPEYEIKESRGQRATAEFLAREGVNLIIGSHPHVVQPFDKIYVPGARDSVPVIFSLGNFISNQRRRYTDGGIIFDVTLQKNADSTPVITNYSYLPFWVYRYNLGAGSVFRLLPDCRRDEGPCSIYDMSEADRKEMELFFEDTRGILTTLPERKLDFEASLIE